MKKILAGTLTALTLLSSTWTADAQTLNKNEAAITQSVKPAAPAAALPKTTGMFQVGTTTFDWLDTSRKDLLTPDSKDHRELIVQAWYPIDSSKGKETEKYIPATAKGIENIMSSLGLGKPFALIATESNHKMLNGQAEQPLPPGLDARTVRMLQDTFNVFRSRYKQAVEGAAYDITIAGATHMSFTDMPLLQPYLVGSPYASIEPATAKPNRLYEVSGSVILSFLEKTLQGKQNTIFDLDRKNLLIPDVKIVQ